MDLIKLTSAHNDSRGSITDLVANDSFDSVTLVSFKEGAIRGNHVHKNTLQWNYVLSGQILVATRLPGAEKIELRLTAGDFFCIRENEEHALLGITDAELLVITKGTRAGDQYEDDTYRSETPLLKK